MSGAASQSVSIGVIDIAKGDTTTCALESWIQVTSVKSESKAFYNCLVGGVTEYDLNITQLSSTSSSTIWGGTFAVAGDDGTHSADVSGSFRIESLAGGGGEGGGGEGGGSGE